jgi:hypothetical protein
MDIRIVLLAAFYSIGFKAKTSGCKSGFFFFFGGGGGGGLGSGDFIGEEIGSVLCGEFDALVEIAMAMGMGNRQSEEIGEESVLFGIGRGEFGASVGIGRFGSS